MRIDILRDNAKNIQSFYKKQFDLNVKLTWKKEHLRMETAKALVDNENQFWIEVSNPDEPNHLEFFTTAGWWGAWLYVGHIDGQQVILENDTFVGLLRAVKKLFK